MQEECKHTNIGTTIGKQESEVTRLAQTLPSKTNTTFDKGSIKKHSVHYQAHLERISDYLVLGKGIWWSEDDHKVTFYDASPPTNNMEPQLWAVTARVQPKHTMWKLQHYSIKIINGTNFKLYMMIDC